MVTRRRYAIRVLWVSSVLLEALRESNAIAPGTEFFLPVRLP
jgi:hypothetical protein